MKINNPKITMLIGVEQTTIEVKDGDASITFLRLKLTPDQLSAALARHGYVECECEVYGLDLIGKKAEHKDFEFEMPPADFSNLVEIAIKEAERLCPEGWESDGYFGSQGSFFTKDGKEMARVTIRRWV